MTQTINNIALIQAVRASQIRRNKAAEGERKRNFARDLFVQYFSILAKGKNELATGKL